MIYINVSGYWQTYPFRREHWGRIVTTATAQIPALRVTQLRPGERMVIPVGQETEVQFLPLLMKHADGSISTQRSLPVRFVPLTRNG